MWGTSKAIVAMSKMPLDLAGSPRIAQKCWARLAGFFANQAERACNVFPKNYTHHFHFFFAAMAPRANTSIF